MRMATKRVKASTGASPKGQANLVVSSIKPGNSDVRISKHKRKAEGKIEKDACEVSFHPSVLQSEPSNDLMKSASEFSAVGSPQCLQCFKKFKLQLFPIDNATRKRLEIDNHNPFLELTLSNQKKISSVVKHLNSKWQISRTSAEELMLFPYDACMDNISVHRRWTLKDSSIIAADVYMAIGSPSIFRLRYGWFLDPEPKIGGLSAISSFLENNLHGTDNQRANVYESTSPSAGLAEVPGSILVDDLNQVLDPISVSDKYAKLSETARTSKNAEILWAADCFSNISVGALLSEASRCPDAHIPITCDSFDAAIAAHIARCGVVPTSSQTTQPSMLDAEETCMAFPFQRDTPSKEAPRSSHASLLNMPAPSDALQANEASLIVTQGDAYTKTAAADDDPSQPEAATVPCPRDFDNPEGTESFLKWPNSIGPWVDGGSSSKLIPASSLDAFQAFSIV